MTVQLELIPIYVVLFVPGIFVCAEHRTVALTAPRIDPKRFDKLVTEDGKVARLIGFFPELGSKETTRKNRLLMDHLNEIVDHSLVRYRITGTTNDPGLLDTYSSGHAPDKDTLSLKLRN